MGTIARQIVCCLLIVSFTNTFERENWDAPLIRGKKKYPVSPYPKVAQCAFDYECLKGKATCVQRECHCTHGLAYGDGKNKCVMGMWCPYDECMDYSNAHCTMRAHPTKLEAICKCNEGYFGDALTTGCEKKRLGRCLTDKNCPRYSTCKNKRCKCKDDLRGPGQYCLPAKPKKCTKDADCGSKAFCELRKCICKGKTIGSGAYCRPGVVKCPNFVRCGSHTTCHADPWFPNKHWYCGCQSGYYKHKDFGCRECLNDKHCPAFSRCHGHDLKCKCRDELVGNGKTCKKAPLLDCTRDDQCHSKAKCYHDKCICQGNTIGNGQFCRDSAPCPKGKKCGKNETCVADPLLQNVNECKCKTYFKRDDQGKCVEMDGCERKGLMCPVHSACEQIENDPFGCVCVTGFKKAKRGNSSTCEDIDECDGRDKRAECSKDRCNNTIGSYTCKPCPQGFFEKDKTCVEDVDECSTGNNKCPERCINTMGSYECAKCPNGTDEYDGKCVSCPDCGDKGFCKKGSAVCTCEVGFASKQGSKCVDIDECSNLCKGAGQLCKNNAGSYACDCKPGYTKKGLRCVKECDCKKHEECHKGKCKCKKGYKKDEQGSCVRVSSLQEKASSVQSLYTISHVIVLVTGLLGHLAFTA